MKGFCPGRRNFPNTLPVMAFTHTRLGGGIFVFGKILYETEARSYLWDGNREVVDVGKALKIHPLVKKKIDRVADECRKKARFFILTFIS